MADEPLAWVVFADGPDGDLVLVTGPVPLNEAVILRDRRPLIRVECPNPDHNGHVERLSWAGCVDHEPDRDEAGRIAARGLGDGQ